MSLAQLVLASSWPPRCDSMRHDADWMLFVWDRWRTTLLGIPSVFE